MVSGSFQCFLLLLAAVMEGDALRVDRQQRDVRIVSKFDEFEKKTSQNSQVSELTITGDPSELQAISRYLSTAFKNHKSYTKAVCERETMTLNCLPGQGIKVIDAFYGRNTQEICFSYPQETSLNCPSPLHALAEVEKRCNHRMSCDVPASNDVFTEPCLNTFKYLRVSYTCAEESPRTASACDQEGVTISCPQGSSIKVNSASYGRTRSDVCNRKGLQLTALTCQVDPRKATNLLIERCDGKPSCTTHTIHDVASNLGNPCSGIFRHLDVNYMCL